MEQNDLNKVIKGTTTAADDEFMAQIADALRARKPMSAAERERYDSINKAREEELKLQKDAFRLEKEGKLNMDMKEHFKARINNQLNEINVFGAMRTASMQQLNEVSVTKRMKKAISKGKSPLVAAAKALLHNVKLRGVRGVISPHDYIARTANALQKKSEMGLNSVEYDYRSPNPLLRAFDVIRGDKRGPIGDDLEDAFADSRERARAAARKGEPIPPIAGVEDVKALRDRYLSFANEKWPRSTTMKDLLSQHFGGLIYPRRGYSLPDVPPQRPAPRPAIPPQESSILSINRSTLPGRGMSEIPAREPTPRDAVRPVDILDINRSGVGPSVIDRIFAKVAKVYRGPQVQDRTGASHGSIPPPRVTTIRNKGRFGRPPSGAPPRDVQRPLF